MMIVFTVYLAPSKCYCLTLIRSNTDGMEVRSVGNSQTLKETALIEAFNLKAAIEYTMKNVEAAKEALTDMPPRQEEELDPVRGWVWVDRAVLGVL